MYLLLLISIKCLKINHLFFASFFVENLKSVEENIEQHSSSMPNDTFDNTRSFTSSCYSNMSSAGSESNYHVSFYDTFIFNKYLFCFEY